jgi:hypothetical protein
VTPKIDAASFTSTNTSGFFLHYLSPEFSDPVTALPFIAQVWIRMLLQSIPKTGTGGGIPARADSAVAN